MSEFNGAEELIKRASTLVERVGNLRHVKHYDQQFGNSGQQEFSVNEYEQACVEMEEVLTQAVEKIEELWDYAEDLEYDLEVMTKELKDVTSSTIRKQCKKIEELEKKIELFKKGDVTK
jgi:hypothetical protein